MGYIISFISSINLFDCDTVLDSAIILNIGSVFDFLIWTHSSSQIIFNPSVSIDYSMDVSKFVEITIVNLEGKVLETLHSSFQNKGLHSVIWNANNVSSGVYFVNVSMAGQTQTQKLMLLK